jgi:pullulanase
MDLRKYLYNENDLGVTFKSDGTVKIKVWAPNIKGITLNLYSNNDSQRLVFSKKMTQLEENIWSIILKEKETGYRTLDKFFYDFKVEHLDGTVKYALDPYAKSMAGFSPDNELDNMGKGAIIDMNSEEAGIKPKSIGGSNLGSSTDMVAYEVHIRDFTIGKDMKDAGTYKGFINYEEGINHLKDLGITHVQFLPVQNYFTVDEGNKKYEDNGDSYNWGYDPHNYFTLEGWLASDEENPYSRICEFRELVNKLHDNGIGVIIDVVYNHTYGWEIFENLTPGSYYRMYDGKISGGTGAGPTLESRNLMVRKLIIDSLKFFVEEYGIDGFRFDLMGFMDIDTMIAIREALGENIILHGEAWNFTDLPITEAPVKGHIANYPHDVNLALFNDSTRDSYVGATPEKGFIQGNYDYTPVCRAGIIGNIIDYYDKTITIDTYHRFSCSPNETLQYLSIHDGFTLWDKINLSYSGTMEERARLVRFSLGMLFTSQGKIIIQGGTEIGLTKPLGEEQKPRDPEPGRAHTSDLINFDDDIGEITHYHENSYSSSDFVNKIRWERKKHHLFKGLYDYCCGLIELRRSASAFRYSTSKKIKEGLKFILTDDFNAYRVIAYTLDNTLEDNYGNGIEKSPYKKYLVIHNAAFETLELKDLEFKEHLDILVDSVNAGTTPLKDTKIKVEDGKLTITPSTTVILGERE